jgi:Ca-activated chloride channel family protein
MKLNARLQFDLIAIEGEDTVHALLEVTAPNAPKGRKRPPAKLQLVLDRSGSMAGLSLDACLRATDELISRLRPDDRLGLVAFDGEVHVPIPAAALGDKLAARTALAQIYPGGSTNLSGGLLRGIQEANRGDGNGGTTLVLLSDGHANNGIVDHAKLAQVSAGGQRSGVETSTIGIGLGYDEDLLDAISQAGSGNAHFAEEGDAASAALASEVDGLLDQVSQAVSLTIRPSEDVSAVRLFNDLPVSGIEGGFMVELGGFYGEETRRLLLEIDVPAMSGLGLAEVCRLELRWVDVKTMKGQVATIPVNVNVVPGDAAAGRTADPEVTTELVFQRAQRAKREASDALDQGDDYTAKALYKGARDSIVEASPGAPATLQEDLEAEIATFDRLMAEVESGDAFRARKRAMADYHMRARKRGRRREP